jgi:SNARE protein
MKNLELMELGRKQIDDTDLALARSQKVVDDTIAIGARTAESLQTQGRQLEKIGADLDEIQFSIRKAREIIRDMAKNLTKDKCIMSFLLLVILAVVAVVIIKAAHIGNNTAAG